MACVGGGIDGKWSAFAHPDLYRAARTAGEVFQAVFRRELTVSLGVEWRPGRHVPEIAGVPSQVVESFSKRRAQIEAWLAATGRSFDGESQQEATLVTRRGKPEVEDTRFDEAWKQEAAQVGWGPDQAAELLATRMVSVEAGWWRMPEVVLDDEGAVFQFDRTVSPEEWIGDVLRELTRSDTTFTRHQLVAAVAARLGNGATVETIERVAARALASDQIVHVGPTGDRTGWGRPSPLHLDRHVGGGGPICERAHRDRDAFTGSLRDHRSRRGGAIESRGGPSDRGASLDRRNSVGRGFDRPGGNRQDPHPRRSPGPRSGKAATASSERHRRLGEHWNWRRVPTSRPPPSIRCWRDGSAASSISVLEPCW